MPIYFCHTRLFSCHTERSEVSIQIERSNPTGCETKNTAKIHFIILSLLILWILRFLTKAQYDKGFVIASFAKAKRGNP